MGKHIAKSSSLSGSAVGCPEGTGLEVGSTDEALEDMPNNVNSQKEVGINQ